MKYFLPVPCAMFFLMVFAATGWSHGVSSFVKKSEGYCLTALYDDGEPMSYASVEITAPNSDIGFQTGRTDRNGCFMFKPDGQGTWQIVVKDGMGHRTAMDVDVSEDADAVQRVEANAWLPTNGLSRPFKVVAGLSVILGITGFIYGWRGRRQSNRVPTVPS